MYAWEPLCRFFSVHDVSLFTVEGQPGAWQGAMMVVAAVCLLLFIGSFMLTREHVKMAKGDNLLNDFRSLVRNFPWWIITGAALCTNLFNTVRGATVAYYFKYYIGDNNMVDLGCISFLFYAGVFLAVGEVCNMISGDVCPSGKLPFSFAYKLNDYPAHKMGAVGYTGVTPDKLPQPFGGEEGKPLNSAKLLKAAIKGWRGIDFCTQPGDGMKRDETEVKRKGQKLPRPCMVCSLKTSTMEPMADYTQNW